MQLSCLFHVHTRRSFDSVLSARKIVSRARSMQTDVLVITDHNTLQGSLDAQRFAGGDGPLVIVAAEYQSDKGDIIGMFLREEIHSRSAAEIISQIHAQGGLAVLPHPFKAHALDDGLLAGIDIIETFNARCTAADNARAGQLATQLNLPRIAGADAHCSLELDAAFNRFSYERPARKTEFRELLLNAPREFATRQSPAFCRPYSQMIKAAKTRSPRLFAYQAKRLAGALLRGNE
jgi:predicted metal-dependent phosphoesterase TrpH